MTTLVKGSHKMNEGVDIFEGRLEQLLRPRQANPEFVSTLKKKLMTTPEITLETRRSYTAFWIIAVSLFMGALTVFLFLRKRQ